MTAGDAAEPSTPARGDGPAWWTLWVTAGVSVIASAGALWGAWNSTQAAERINDDELAARRTEAAAARQHEVAQELAREQRVAIRVVTEAAWIYVQRQTERIPACVQQQSDVCQLASTAAIDGQSKLRTATGTARLVLDDDQDERLSAVESFFANLYVSNASGMPPDEPVDTEGLHEALVFLGSTEPS